MAKGAWRINFEPTIAYVTRTAVSTFTTTVVAPGSPARKTPPKGFPATLRVRPRLSDDGKGSPPVALGAPPVAAVLEFLGRPRGAATFELMGAMNGTIQYVTANGADAPKFVGGTRRVPPATPGGIATSVNDFTAATTAVITRSDWVLALENHPDHFQLGLGSTMNISLPWLFDPAKPEVQLVARLTVGGTVVASETQNTVLGIPLSHEKIDEFSSPDTPPLSLTEYGVRTLMPASLSRPAIPIGTRRFHVFLDTSVTDFIESRIGTGLSAGVRTSIVTVLADLGVTPDVVMTGDATFPAEQTRWATLVTRTQGKFHCMNIRNLTVVPPNSTPGTKTFLPDRDSLFDNDGSVIPFFDFFVGLETTDPPTDELGIGEMENKPKFDVAAATKRLATPIVLFGGASNAGGIRAQLAKVAAADRPNFMANVILHEIGHALGLRHGCRVDQSAGYVDTDADGISNSLLFPRGIIQSTSSTGGAPCRLNFFGPVQRAAVRKNFSIA